MELFLKDYITSSSFDDDDVNKGILERRISPYVTLRPGDLSALLKLYTDVQPPLAKFGHNHNHVKKQHGCGIETLFEKKPLLSAGDSDDDKSDDELLDVVCNGAHQGHVPAQYVVRGIKRHEFPVIGVYIHEKICPGFQYRVRRVTSKNFFWNGQAKTLLSIGTGYGARLTFSGETLNDDNFFWSDSDPDGFAFSIHAVDADQKFLIQDVRGKVVGEGIVERIHGPQQETNMITGKNGVTKHVDVTLTCCITYYKQHHYGLKEMMVHESQETVTGEAILFKPRSSRKANLLAIEGVFLPRIGDCKFVPDC
ncbi:hypothetical protein BgiMline_015392 [Biomphalaria glabrata]|nr:CAunnamed protein product [Biomphalaria glabrata]